MIKLYSKINCGLAPVLVGTRTIRNCNQGYCVRRLISTELHLSVFGTETISSDKG